MTAAYRIANAVAAVVLALLLVLLGPILFALAVVDPKAIGKAVPMIVLGSLAAGLIATAREAFGIERKGGRPCSTCGAPIFEGRATYCSTVCRGIAGEKRASLARQAARFEEYGDAPWV